jgi:hypothetical protein
MTGALTNQQAFEAMVFFLEAYYARTKSDDVGGLLGDLMRRKAGGTADPASRADWLESVRKARSDKWP